MQKANIDEDVFMECWGSCDTATNVEIWNKYARNNDPNNEIFENGEDFFNTYYYGKPMDAVRAVSYGEYSFTDTYVWNNGYGNLDSSDYYSDMPIDEYALLDYLQNNPEILQEYPDFDACFENDDEE